MSRTLVLAVVSVLAALSGNAYADTMYVFTGGPYTQIIAGNPPTDRVTGTITLSDPLAPNLNDALLSPASFSFTDGLSTFTSNTYSLVPTFSLFNTDSQGQITGYYIGLEPEDSSNYIVLYATLINPFGTPYEVGYTFAENGAYFAESDIPGTFTRSTPASITPEPSTFALLGTGFLGVAGTLKRRRT